MAKRVVLGGILGGILGGLTMFVWLFVAHDFLPLGELGVQEIANDGPVPTAMQAAIPQAGLYLFPGMGLGPNPTMQQRNAAMPAYMKKYEQSPHGILVYHPPSGVFNFGAALAREGAINLLGGLLVAWLLSMAAAGRAYSARVGFVVILGVLAAVTTPTSNTGIGTIFPATTSPVTSSQIIGFTLVGLVVAAVVKSEVAPRS